MADEMTTPENDAQEKKFTQAEFEQKIKDRLKNSTREKQELLQRLEQLEAQNAQQPEVAPQMAQAPMPAASPESMAQMPGMDVSGQPLTADQMQSILNDHQKKIEEANQEAQMNNAFNHHLQNIDRIKKEDPKFEKLAGEDNPLNVPAEVGVYISNNLTPNESKKLFTELLTNEMSNLKMKNAFLQGGESFSQWFHKILSQAKKETGKAPEVVPDLSKDTVSGVSSSNMDNVENYMKKYY